MKIDIKVHQIVDGAIEFVSLVKNGANRAPFKIIKAEDQKPSWLDHMPEFKKLKQRLDNPALVTKETKTVKMKEVIAGLSVEPVQKAEADEARKLEIVKLRHKLSGLNNQQLRLWESPQHPLFKKLDEDYALAIYKAEAELAVLVDDQPQMQAGSAFFRRGGVSIRSSATVYDSADQRHDVRKGEETIDLSPMTTQADFNAFTRLTMKRLTFST